MKTFPNPTLVLDETDARLDAMGFDLRAWLSALREELAAFPPELPRTQSRFA